MALKISNLAKKEKTIILDLGDGDEVELTYNPFAFTKQFYAELQENKEENSLFTAIVENVKRWSVVDDDGEIIPITVDFLKTLPMNLVMQMWVGVLKDSQDFDPKLKSA